MQQQQLKYLAERTYSYMAVTNRDGANVVSPDWSLVVTKSVTFDGGTTNAPGDHDGTGDPISLFTVSGGPVLMRVFGICTADLVGASATLEVGTALSTAGLIAQTTATNIDNNEIWHDSTPDASVELSTVATQKIVNQSVIATVGTANITAGSITFYCAWFPLTNDAKVVAA